ncbi:transcription elongation regulator 1-like protein [Paroedura picta]|uniref:transcription elongation regulator 1-like protein n=1 Tax=Paroedura picta TaxID=143630 RepID=UPI004057675E
MLPVPRAKRRQPLLWPGNAEPPAPPWIWMVPSAAGLFRIGGAAGVVPPPLLLSSPPHPPPPPPAPLLQGVSGWQVPCDPFLPLMAPEHHSAVHQLPFLNGQWIFGTHSPAIGFSPSSSLEFAPLFPHVYTTTGPPHSGKSWIEKRLPNCKIYLNNAFALDSAWIHPEEVRIYQGHEKPLLMTNQVAVALSRPAAAPRPLPAMVLTPQPIPGGCLKHAGSNQTIAFAAAMVSVDAEAPQGPSTASVQPCHVLTLSPIKIPVLTSPFPGGHSRMDTRMTSLMPAQVTRVAAISSPSVTFMATNLVDQTLTDKGKESNRPSCPPTLILHTEIKNKPTENEAKSCSIKLLPEDGSASNGNKPVASTPVPGSPWCVVWTGDDRVFFFNPTMQLSVWEKPVDLKNRGDLNRIIEDPPHKRKLETSATDKSDDSSPEDINNDHSTKTKRNKLEDPQNAEPEKEEKIVKASEHQIMLPLEERITHFRDMLLERGVSAFSTWEKELHKIVFDPRYLLLNSEERKQIFEQFVKTRIREEYKEKKNKLLLAKEEFKKLLEESKLSPRTTFKEFAEKYGRDQRFRLVQKKKDQEHFFNQFILILKKRDKENRIRLRKMR